jgi:voltage-gated potassium channel
MILIVLIGINIISIFTSIIFAISGLNLAATALDIFICAILLFDFFRGFFASSNHSEYVKGNWFELLVAIPFDLLLFPFLGFNYLVFFKAIRVLLLIILFFRIAGEFLKNTHLDEILGVLTFIIIGATLGLYFVDPSMNNIFDNLWFVIVSITTVGYGDITPNTVSGKIFSLALLVIGVFIFSAITGAISTYFMDNVLQEGSYHIRDLKEKAEKSESELEKITNQLNESNKKIEELKDEIKELKRIIEKNS